MGPDLPSSSAVLETSLCRVTSPKADSSQEHHPKCVRAVWSQAHDSLLSRSKENDLTSKTHTEAMQEVKGENDIFHQKHRVN